MLGNTPDDNDNNGTPDHLDAAYPCKNQDVHCKQCTNADTCTACDAGYILDENGACKLICDDANCDTCSSIDTCTTCKTGYELDGNNACKLTCDDANCETCSSADNCTTCKTGYEMDSIGGCKFRCGVPHCRVCASASTCASCESNFLLQNSICVSARTCNDIDGTGTAFPSSSCDSDISSGLKNNTAGIRCPSGTCSALDCCEPNPTRLSNPISYDSDLPDCEYPSCEPCDHYYYGVNGLLISQDGKMIFGIQKGRFGNQRFLAWDRNPTTGDLSNYFYDHIFASFQTTPGIVLSSPDNKHVYALTNRIRTYRRNPITGTSPSLTKAGTMNVEGLNMVWSGAISPDGKFLYGADNMYIRLWERNASTGALTYGGIVATSANSENSPEMVISSDGMHLYQLEPLWDKIVHYKRNRMTGALYDEHTYVGSGSAVSQSFALAPSGRNFVLADNGAGGSSNSHNEHIQYSQWRRDEVTGKLSNYGYTAYRAQSWIHGIGNRGVAFSPDSKNVYGVASPEPFLSSKSYENPDYGGPRVNLQFYDTDTNGIIDNSNIQEDYYSVYLPNRRGVMERGRCGAPVETYKNRSPRLCVYVCVVSRICIILVLVCVVSLLRALSLPRTRVCLQFFSLAGSTVPRFHGSTSSFHTLHAPRSFVRYLTYFMFFTVTLYYE
jgi:hypothetical protein